MILFQLVNDCPAAAAFHPYAPGGDLTENAWTCHDLLQFYPAIGACGGIVATTVWFGTQSAFSPDRDAG